MPQFDLKGRGDIAGAISKGNADVAAKNPNGPKGPMKGKADNAKAAKVPAVPGSLNYYMRKTKDDGKGNAYGRAYALWARDKKARARGGR